MNHHLIKRRHPQASLIGTILLFFVTLIPTFAIAQNIPSQPRFHNDIRPIIEHTCVSCHGCFDAPCQLKMETPEGIDRGANTKSVYGVRMNADEPTRLFTDALTTDSWRNKGFFPVLPNERNVSSLMESMLKLGREQRYGDNQRLPDNIELGLSRQHSCPNPEEFDDYAKNNPHGGMPFAITGLSDQDYSTMRRWLQQGAELERHIPKPTTEEQKQIEQWETFLNQPGKPQQLVARWLYEHLFLAHLYLDDESGERPANFFRLVRSFSAPGKPVRPVGTTRPNDPVEGEFWYRLEPISGTIVHKRHITFPINDAKLARTRSLFFSDDWDVETLPGYDYEYRANPFVTFAAIPPRARYQFMLDEAEYFTRTFIRGPVCRGQIATDVIRDQFWALFQHPDDDLFVTDPEYHDSVKGLLGLPGQKDNLLALGSEWRSYRNQRNKYERLRQNAYHQHQPEGPDWNSLWDGDGDNTNALLTIFRHHDNASVRRGLIGDYPLTTWVMDYPLFERSYYNLVVNFDVFGNASHQVQTRLYFDLIRNGSEQNALRFLPAEKRKEVLNNWYQGTGKLRLMVSYNEVDTDTPAATGLETSAPMVEFNDQLVHRFAHLNLRPDPINRCDGKRCTRNQVADWQAESDQALSRLASRQAANLPLINKLPEVTFLQVEGPGQQLEVYTVTRNRAHSNVAFMLGEELRYQPKYDTLTIYPGILASYPNFMFRVHYQELDELVSAFEAVKDADDLEPLLQRYGVRRTHPQFWSYFQDLTAYLKQHEPIEAGVLDLNRYENL